MLRRLLQISPESDRAALPAARPPRRWFRAWLIVAVVLTAAAPKIWPNAQLTRLWSELVAAGSTAARAEPAPALESAATHEPVKVIAVTVRPAPLAEIVTSTGTLLAAEGVDLQAEVSGKIVKIAFAKGARVRMGDLLVKLTAADLQAMRVAVTHELDLAQSRERCAAELLAQGKLRSAARSYAGRSEHVSAIVVQNPSAEAGAHGRFSKFCQASLPASR